MTTVSDIVARAFGKARIVGYGRTPPADYAASGLEDFNSMMHSLALRSTDTTHTNLSLADNFPLDEKFEEGIVYMLAQRLAHDVAFPVGFDADAFFREIQAAYHVGVEMSVPSALSSMPSQIDRGN